MISAFVVCCNFVRYSVGRMSYKCRVHGAKTEAAAAATLHTDVLKPEVKRKWYQIVTEITVDRFGPFFVWHSFPLFCAANRFYRLRFSGDYALVWVLETKYADLAGADVGHWEVIKVGNRDEKSSGGFRTSFTMT